MAKVFVTQFMKNIDYAKAEKFGEVVFISDGDFHPDPVMPIHNRRTSNDIEAALVDYDPNIDYILVAPNNVINIYVGSQLEKGWHNILKWDNREMKYRVYRVNIN